MYLKKLYTANKFWFIIIMLFAIIQLAMDVRQDVAMSPVFHYGMYSGTQLPQQKYLVNEIRVNGRLLQTKGFSPYQWDRIARPVEMFNKQQEWNSAEWANDIKHVLHFTDSTKYVNHITTAEFNTWYKNYLSNTLHEKVDTVEVSTARYVFNGITLIRQTN